MHYTAVFIYMQVVIFNKVSDIIGVKSFNGIAFRRRLTYTVFDYSEIFAPSVFLAAGYRQRDNRNSRRRKSDRNDRISYYVKCT